MKEIIYFKCSCQLVIANLWLHVQHGDFALLVDLLDGLNFGTEHISLEAAVLQ